MAITFDKGPTKGETVNALLDKRGGKQPNALKKEAPKSKLIVSKNGVKIKAEF